MTFLHTIGETLRVLFEQIPLTAARWILIGVFLLLLFWIVQLPSASATPTDRQSKWYEDLRLWAWLALMIQIVLYSLF